MKIQQTKVAFLFFICIITFSHLRAQDTLSVKGIDAAIRATQAGKYVSVLLASDTSDTFPERFFELPEDKVIGLIIDNCGYLSFPKRLARYQGIIYFRYSWFFFKDAPNNDFPDFVLKLKNLQDLRIDRILIPSVPKGIKKLKKLEYFELYACKVPEFPHAILKLKNLKHLRLPCNLFTVIPSKIDRLENLKTLSFEGGACGSTPIDLIPESIGSLKALQTFELGYSKKGIDSLPDVLFDLTELRRLECNGCGLRTLPEKLARLEKLESIALSNMRDFQGFPEAFFNLPKVQNFRFYQYGDAPNPKLLEQAKRLDEWGKRLEKYSFEINGYYPEKR